MVAELEVVVLRLAEARIVLEDAVSGLPDMIQGVRAVRRPDLVGILGSAVGVEDVVVVVDIRCDVFLQQCKIAVGVCERREEALFKLEVGDAGDLFRGCRVVRAGGDGEKRALDNGELKLAVFPGLFGCAGDPAEEFGGGAGKVRFVRVGSVVVAVNVLGFCGDFLIV